VHERALVIGLSVFAIVAVGRGARADDLAGLDSEIHVHGFVSQGALITTDNNYLAETERGSLEFTEAGINFTKGLGDRLRVGFQLFARDLGPFGNYDAKFDWFYLDYRWRDWLGIRAGRVKLPFGLYNETSDIDAAHPVVLLPQSIYSITGREFQVAQTGVELYGYKRFEQMGALDYRAFLGTLFLDIPDSLNLDVSRSAVPYVAGGRVMWELPLDGLRIGASALTGRIEVDYTVQDMPLAVELNATQWLTSIEYVANNFHLAAEYGRTHFEQTTMGMTSRSVAEHGYGLAAYRWRAWLQTALYYSAYYPNVDDRAGREARQHDAAATVRFDISPYLVFKLEGHALRGTAALSPALNGNTPRSSLHNRWWMLAAKATAYF
jgi:hypothetical protein